MGWFSFQQGELHAEQVPTGLLADQFGTPLYVYSREGLTRGYQAYESALGDWPHMICYAVKANSNLAVLSVLAKLGAGFDIVSVGELERVLAAGGDAGRIVFSGVGKNSNEIRRAIEAGVHCFNVESEQEIDHIQAEAKAQDTVAAISLRVNPDVDAQTHPYISTGLKENKFGIDFDRAIDVYNRAAKMSHLNIVGVDCHIGSQLTSEQPFVDALDRLLVLVDQLKELGIDLKHIDIGGGLGIQYKDEEIPSLDSLIEQVKQRLLESGHSHLALLVEPGRSISGQAGILLTRVELIKQTPWKDFAIVDGAMNDLLRPSIYSAWHNIQNTLEKSEAEPAVYDIVGPVCETGDFLGKERELAISEGDLLAVYSSGAYGFTMSSNYNSRNRPAEVMVDGDQAHLVRRRETIEDQLSLETIIETSI